MKTIKKLELRGHRVRLAAVAAEERAAYATQCRTPAVSASLASMLIGDEDAEVVIAIALDVRNKVIGYYEVARGAVDACHVDIRQAFRNAVMIGASGIIFAHNHPSGDATPSAEDRALTRRLVEAGELLGIPTLDHLVVTWDGPYYSFAFHGEL